MPSYACREFWKGSKEFHSHGKILKIGIHLILLQLDLWAKNQMWQICPNEFIVIKNFESSVCSGIASMWMNLKLLHFFLNEKFQYFMKSWRTVEIIHLIFKCYLIHLAVAKSVLFTKITSIATIFPINFDCFYSIPVWENTLYSTSDHHRIINSPSHFW